MYSVLCDADNFIKGPIPLFREVFNHLERGFVVKDKNYLAERWTSDATNFSLEVINMLKERKNETSCPKTELQKKKMYFCLK